MTVDERRSKGGLYPMRRGSPPGMEVFSAPENPAGDRILSLDLSGLRITLEGLGADLEQVLRRRYERYLGRAGSADELRMTVSLDPREYFIAPLGRTEFNPVFLTSEGSRVRFAGMRLAAWFDVVSLTGKILLARGTFEPEPRAFENCIRTAVAWLAASRGGALVHGASAIRNERAYLFYGQSGAGKSTLAANTVRGRIVSDDLTLVLPGEGKLEVVGSPFRGTYEGGEPVTGRYPLAAGFRLVQAPRAEVRSVARVRALAELVGNLPFVAEEFPRRPDLFERVEHAFRDVPLAHLLFRMDDSYWDAIEEAGL